MKNFLINICVFLTVYTIANNISISFISGWLAGIIAISLVALLEL